MKKARTLTQRDELCFSHCKSHLCECYDWQASFKNDATYVSWMHNLRDKWDALSTRQKICYMDAHVWWLVDETYVGEENQRRYGFPRAYETYHVGAGGIYKYKLCVKMFRYVLGLQGQDKWTKLMTQLFEFKQSGNLVMETQDIPRQEPRWMPEFESWFLQNVKYEQSHYSVKNIPYLVVKPQEHTATKKKGQHMTASPKEMLRYMYIICYICYVTRATYVSKQIS